VFDTVTMEHTKPVGEGELYKKIGIDPKEDWNNIVLKYDARKQNYQEYGRLAIINKDHYLFNFLSIKGKEILMTLQRHVNDYDLPSRVRSQLRKLGVMKGSKNERKDA